MKKSLRIIAVLLLVPIITLSLFGCGGKKTQNGILISPEAEYNGVAKMGAQSAFYEWLAYYMEKTTGMPLTKYQKSDLNYVAQDMASIAIENPIDETLFLQAMMTLYEHSHGVIDELLLFSATRKGGLPKTRALYLELVSILDSDAIVDTLYRLLLYGYESRYKTAMEDYEYHPYPHILERAEALAREKKTFAEQIGPEGFETVFLHSLAFSELFLSDALSSETFSSFTDTEILLFLKSLELSETQISTEGWSLILEKMLPEKAMETYASRLGAALLQTGDYKNLATVMNDLTALFSSATASLTAEEVALLRKGDRAAAVQSIMQKFTDADFARLERISAVSLNKSAYHSAALQTYGAGYSVYASGIKPIGIAELRADLGNSTFYESLEKFVAGISPAFSYGMKK